MSDIQGVQKKVRKVNRSILETIMVWDTIHDSYERGTLRVFISPSTALYGRHLLCWDSLDVILSYPKLFWEFPVLFCGTQKQLFSSALLHCLLVWHTPLLRCVPTRRSRKESSLEIEQASQRVLAVLSNSYLSFYSSKLVLWKLYGMRLHPAEKYSPPGEMRGVGTLCELTDFGTILLSQLHFRSRKAL